MKSETGLHMGEKERQKKEVDKPRLVGGGFNKGRNSYTRLILGGQKTSKPLHLPSRILKVYIASLMGLVTYTVQMISTTPYSFKAMSLEWLPLWEWWAEYIFQKQGRG